MKQIDNTYKEELVIPVYDEDKYKDRAFFKDGSECHYTRKEKTFKYEEILAITTRETAVDTRYHGKRGGALIYVRKRKEPYLAADGYSVSKIYKMLNQNPFACYSGLNMIGSNKIYAKEGKVKGNEFIMSNGVRLYLNADACRHADFIMDTLDINIPLKEHCFYETKMRHRRKSSE